MEIIVKIAIFVATGVLLLICNIWFATAVYRNVTGSGDLVIAPVKVIGGTGDAALTGEALARLIIARLQSRAWDLEQSQSSLASDKRATPTLAEPRGMMAGILGTPKTAVLNAQLFEPTNIDVRVAGVEVGGLLPGIQRWFVHNRTLSLAVSWDGKSAIVAGNVDALGLGKAKPLMLPVPDATENSIADAIALALIHRHWAKDSPEYSELDDEEFGKLADSIGDTARINRRVLTYNVAAKKDYERVLLAVGPLADRIGGWNELTLFVASIAEGAEDYQHALTLYRRIQTSPKSKLDPAALNARIASLETLAAKAAPDKTQSGLAIMAGHVKQATNLLNQYFKAHLAEPPIKLKADDYRNAYWDGTAINAPLRVQNIPDIMYHETAWPFVQSVWSSFKYTGQEGAIVSSYKDVLTSMVKQKLQNQTAQTADWVIAPGAIAWVTDKNDPKDQRPLRSMKAPGTAYDDPAIGKDLQPDHYSKLVTTSDDSGGIHTNSGIMNRAFYETAMRLGTDKAGEIWISSLPSFKPRMDFRSASKIIFDTAVKSYGEGSNEAKAVKAGFNVVGL